MGRLRRFGCWLSGMVSDFDGSPSVCKSGGSQKPGNPDMEEQDKKAYYNEIAFSH